jgi:hypothetical protein
MTTKKLITTALLLVALATLAIVSPTPASARIDDTAFAGQFRARAVGSATAGVPSTRRPVAMVPGLKYNPRTMIPRGICRADLDSRGI